MGDLSEHFSRREFACKDGCGNDTIDHQTLEVLEDLRSHFGLPISVNSGYRCAKRNKAVGGAMDSQHLRGRAADIDVRNISPSDVYKYLCETYPGKYGFGLYKTFVHVDTRTNGPARWSG